MSTKLLSIVIPVYNSSKTIDALFKTIDFSYRDDFEILVIDDGSLDNLRDKIIA
jgi:glycosyltransferase involved in cell wall biosynthesis